MKNPNVFLVGAPKCGTTSMANWLAAHPMIYMSPLKEPHYFDTDHVRDIRDLRDYERLFERASHQHLAVGEASVRYLHSQVAVRNIIEYNPDARFVAMLRNPVEMAPSFHEQLVFSLHEDIEDFEAAWRLQAVRLQGQYIPVECDDPQLIQYESYCRLGDQLQRLFNVAGRERCHVILMDDLKIDPRSVYLGLLKHIGVPDDGRVSFPLANTAKAMRSRAVAAMMKRLVEIRRAMIGDRSFGLANSISRLNRKERARGRLSASMRAELVSVFDEDIRLIEELISRDLSHWRAV